MIRYAYTWVFKMNGYNKMHVYTYKSRYIYWTSYLKRPMPTTLHQMLEKTLTKKNSVSSSLHQTFTYSMMSVPPFFWVKSEWLDFSTLPWPYELPLQSPSSALVSDRSSRMEIGVVPY